MIRAAVLTLHLEGQPIGVTAVGEHLNLGVLTREDRNEIRTAIADLEEGELDLQIEAARALVRVGMNVAAAVSAALSVPAAAAGSVPADVEGLSESALPAAAENNEEITATETPAAGAADPVEALLPLAEEVATDEGTDVVLTFTAPRRAAPDPSWTPERREACIEETIRAWQDSGHGVSDRRWRKRAEIAMADGITDAEELKSGRYATVLQRAQARVGFEPGTVTLSPEPELFDEPAAAAAAAPEQALQHPIVTRPEQAVVPRPAQLVYALDDDAEDDISAVAISAPIHEIRRERQRLESALGIDSSRRMGKTTVAMSKRRVRDGDYVEDVWYGSVRTVYASVPPAERQQLLLDRQLDGILTRIPARAPTIFTSRAAAAAATDRTGVIASTDGHVGQVPVNGEWGVERSCQVIEMAVSQLADTLQADGCRQLILMAGSDVAHTDDGRSTTSGTPQDTGATWTVMVEAIIAMHVRIIGRLLTQFEVIDVGVILGNHGTRTDYMVGKVLQALYINEPRIRWQIERDGDPHLLIGMIGGGAIGLAHGHHGKISNLAENFRAKFSQEWSRYTFIEILHGHFHHAMQTDSAGVPIIGCGSPAPTDTWHGNSQYGYSARHMSARIYDRHGVRSAHMATVARIDAELTRLAEAAD